jgi:replicative DNA helicase
MEETFNSQNDTRRQIRKKNPGQSPLDYGKLPPQALDLEEAVLGAIMLEKDAVTVVMEILKPEFFYKDEHQKIFAAATSLFGKSQPVDILTVTNELKKNGTLDLVGGPYYVAQLTSRVGSAANVEFHARIISEKFIKRELIRISGEIQTDAFDDTVDTFDLLDKSEEKLYALVENNIKRGFDKVGNLISDAIKQIEEMAGKEGGITGVHSGYLDLDRMTSGWQRSDLIIMAARPGMGKTSFSLSTLRNAAVDFNHPVAIFSLEMSNLQLVNRLISAETGISSEVLRKGQLTEDQWKNLHSKIARLSEAPIFIDDTPALSIFEFRAKARRLKMQHNIQMIIIDYLQLMTAGGDGKSGNREQEISTISRSLKSIAKELNIPIMALSQLSRAVETRGGDKKPQLSDLRESGAIEQDADMVFFIYRPEYYGFEHDEAGNSFEGIAEIIIAKHRNGATGSVQLRFINELARFENLYEASINMAAFRGDKQFDDFQMNTIIKQSRMNDDFGGPSDPADF